MVLQTHPMGNHGIIMGIYLYTYIYHGDKHPMGVSKQKKEKAMDNPMDHHGDIFIHLLSLYDITIYRRMGIMVKLWDSVNRENTWIKQLVSIGTGFRENLHRNQLVN